MERQCKKCGQRANAGAGPAAACPGCGAIYAKVEQALADSEPMAHASVPRGSQNQQEASPLLGILLVLIVAGLIVSFVIAPDEPEAPKYTAGSAVAACKQFVDKRLKAPASAEYQWVPDVTGSGTGPWVVRSYVDSHNSFGAMLRLRFQCTVHFEGGMVYLDDLNLR